MSYRNTGKSVLLTSTGTWSFDGDRHLRFRARRGFLTAVKGEDGKISGWVRSGQWPPPAGFFESGPVGFAHYVQTWFRYYLQQWIEKRQGELETKEGVYSYGLRGDRIPNLLGLRAGNGDGVFLCSESDEMVQSRPSSSPQPLSITKENSMENTHNHRLPLSDLIRERRNTLGLTQQRIADTLQVTPESIGLWERQKRRIDLDRVPHLAAVLQLDEQDVCRLALFEHNPACTLPCSAPNGRPTPATWNNKQRAAE